jgi:hypothetical protein
MFYYLVACNVGKCCEQRPGNAQYAATAHEHWQQQAAGLCPECRHPEAALSDVTLRALTAAPAPPTQAPEQAGEAGAGRVGVAAGSRGRDSRLREPLCCFLWKRIVGQSVTKVRSEQPYRDIAVSRILMFCWWFCRDFNAVLIEAMEVCNDESNYDEDGSSPEAQALAQRRMRVVQELAVLPETYHALSHLILAGRQTNKTSPNSGGGGQQQQQQYMRSLGQQWGMAESGQDAGYGYGDADADQDRDPEYDQDQGLLDDEDGGRRYVDEDDEYGGNGGNDDDWMPLDLDRLDELGRDDSAKEKQIANMVLHLAEDPANPLNRERNYEQKQRRSASEPAFAEVNQSGINNSNSVNALPPIKHAGRSSGNKKAHNKSKSKHHKHASEGGYDDDRDSAMKLLDSDTLAYFQQMQQQIQQQKLLQLQQQQRQQLQGSYYNDDRNYGSDNAQDWLFDEPADY